jgi:hypothetical protein
MNVVERRKRKAQLLNLRANDPLKMVETYRRVIGLNWLSMLPGGMDFTSLVKTILDHKTATGRLSENRL